MAGLRGVFSCFKRNAASSTLLIGVFTFIIIYLLKATTLDNMLSVSDIFRTINDVEIRLKNEDFNEGDFKDTLNLLRQQPFYKGLYNLLLKQVRVNIKQRFKNIPSDITFKPGHKVSIEDSRRILIVSSFRSGSTFLGDLLQSYQGVFYSYEPLHLDLDNTKITHLDKEQHIHKSLKLIKDISVCNLTSHVDYLMYLRKNDYIMQYNQNYWQSCSLNPAFCFDPNFISDVCRYLPLNVIKLVRLGLDPVMSLLQNRDLNFKILHLVRDPRGMLNSRRNLSWCKHKSCRDSKTVCNNLLYDLHISKYFSTNYPEQYFLVRYEDLSINTTKTAKEIFTFLGLTLYDTVQKFIETHTSGGSAEIDPYTTYRDSQKTAFAWRDTLSYDDMDGIQKYCRKPLEMLGLRYFETDGQYKNKTISAIKGPPVI